MTIKKEAEPASDAGYDFVDFRDVFLAAVTGMVQRSGLMMADEGHFKAIAHNIEGFAETAAKVLRRQKRARTEA